MKVLRVTVIFSLCVLMTYCAGRRASSQPGVRLDFVYTSNLGAELEPCGCRERPMGGVVRKLNFVNRLRDQKFQPFLIDSGDLLFESNRIHPDLREQLIFKGHQIVAAYNLMQHDVVSVGSRDLAAGVEVMRTLFGQGKFAVISANLVDAKTNAPLYPGHHIIARHGVRVAFIGLSPEKVINSLYSEEVKALPYEDVLKREIRAVKSQSDLIVVLIHEEMRDVRALAAKFDDVPLWLTGDSGGSDQPEFQKGQLFLNPMLQAQKVGHLHFAWPGGVDRWVSNHLQLTLGNDIEKLKKEIAELEEITGADNDAMMNDEVGYKKGALKEKQELLARGESGEVAFDHDMVIMHDEYEGRNAAERIVSDYKTAVAKKKYTIESPVGESYTELANLPDSLRPKGLVQPGAEGVSTNVRCETCHEAQFKFQQTTPHYSAILALATKDQHLNRECLTCHTIGFKEPQGWVDPNRLVRGARGREFHTADFIKEVMKADLPEFKGKQMRVRQDRRRWERLHERYLTLLKPYIAKPQKPSASEVSDGTRVYMGVQCEHCHGRRLNHPADGRQYPNAVQKDTCLTCHTPENDDSFSFEKKLPLVACPRMKK